MRKLISGKVYDTEKATLLAEYAYGYPGDFSRIYEALYKTPKGNFFLYFEGGPSTEHAVQISRGTWAGGRGIQALTEHEVLDWLEKRNISPDKIIEHLSIEIEYA